MFPCLNEEEVEWAKQRAVQIAQTGRFSPDECMYLDREASLKVEPALGPNVLGSLYFPKDGHVNPKRLVRAYKSAAENSGVEIRRGEVIERIEYID